MYYRDPNSVRIIQIRKIDNARRVELQKAIQTDKNKLKENTIVLLEYADFIDLFREKENPLVEHKPQDYKIHLIR